MKEERFKRILITRTDRIGDVLLSTPVFKLLRQNFPHSYIAVIVRPYTRDIVLGNPYVNEVIIYDKYGIHKSVFRTVQFAWKLRKKKFDLALVLHPTNRAHLITFLGGIKIRIGFNKKMGFFLTDKIEHKKQEGKKHELDYTLDLVRSLGIETNQELALFMPIRKDSEDYIKKFLAEQGVKNVEKLIAFHPGASCPSKIWPVERFAEVANKLTKEFSARVVLIGGRNDKVIARNLSGLLKCAYINTCGKLSVSELASLLRRCSLLISNDSGPMHIACACSVPVVAIFGRSQPGLGPERWGPRGENCIMLHKKMPCQPCLAHRCVKGFLCLKAVSDNEVISAARRLLQGGQYFFHPFS